MTYCIVGRTCVLVSNPFGWFGKAWLFESVHGQRIVVEAGNEVEAVDELCDSEWKDYWSTHGSFDDELLECEVWAGNNSERIFNIHRVTITRLVKPVYVTDPDDPENRGKTLEERDLESFGS